MLEAEITALGNLVSSAQKIVVIQADNPDGDSLASSLALEQIFGEMGKDVYQYCSIGMPDYLRHLEGWDRVESLFPSSYDLAVLVDSASASLVENLQEKAGVPLSKKPLAIFDHHATESTLEGASMCIDTSSVSTGQVIWQAATQLGWKLDKVSASYIASSILSDTLGLTTDALTDNPEPFVVMSKLVELGVDLSQLNAKRLESMKFDRSLVPYKGELYQRVEFTDNGKIASVVIPHEEIKEHSMRFNPTVVLDELRMVKGVLVTLGIKQYVYNGSLGRVTVRIRCDRTAPIAQELAEHFGGGGHAFASGIKYEGSDLNFSDIKFELLQKTNELLSTLEAR